VQKVMEQEGWQLTTHIDLNAFFILIARMKRDLSTSLGPNYLAAEAAQIRRAFCSLYTDTSGKPAGACRCPIPAEILRHKLVEKGPEPLPQTLYDKFRVEMPVSCLVDGDRSFDAEALYEFCSKSCALEDIDDGEDRQRKEQEKVKAEEKRLEKQQEDPLGPQAAHRQEDADRRDGWRLPEELFGNVSNVAQKTTAKLGKYSKDFSKGIRDTIASGLQNIVPQELREELIDGFGEMTKQAGEYASMVGLGLDGDDELGDDTNYEVLFPEFQRHEAGSAATTSSGSLSNDDDDDDDDDDNDDVRSQGSGHEPRRDTLVAKSNSKDIEDTNFDELFIVDGKTNMTVAEHLAAGRIDQVRNLKVSRRKGSSRLWSVSEKEPHKHSYAGMTGHSTGDHQRGGFATRSDDEEEDVGYLGSPTRVVRRNAKEGTRNSLK